ncbi:hypothetical protein ACHAW6_004337 [Cyclotella cf. meneghiniana]
MNASCSPPSTNRDNKKIQLPTPPVEPQTKTTKFRPKNQNVTRDIAIVLTLISVLYKLCTHPMLASLGYIDPHARKPMSREDVLANMLKNMALNKYKETLQKRIRFLEVVDLKKCYDFSFKIKAAEDVIIKSNSANSKKRAKFRPGYKGTNDGVKRKNNHRSTKKNRKNRFSRKSPVPSTGESPSSTPWATSVASGIMLAFNPPPLKSAMKGSDATAGNK